MKSILPLAVTAKFIIACWTIGTSCAPWQPTRCEVFADGSLERFGVEKKKLVPIPETKPLPPPADARDSDALPSALIDARPVVYFYSAPFHCPACNQGKADIENGNLPWFNVEFKDAPAWVKSFPTLHFRDAKGSWRQYSGWTTPGAFVQAWQAVNPEAKLTLPPAASVAAPVGSPPPSANGESPLALFTTFAGPGDFDWKPKKRVAAYVEEDLFLEYDHIVGTVTLVNGQPVATFRDPKPIIHARKLGFWVTVDLLSVSTELDAHPPTATVRHSMGTKRFVIKEMK